MSSEDLTFAEYRDGIEKNATREFRNHILEVVSPKVWRCWNGKNIFYRFYVAVLPGLIVTWGDVGTLVIDAPGGYDIPWLRGIRRESRNYLLEKCSLEKRTCLLRREFMRWAQEHCTPEEIATAKDFGWNETAWTHVEDDMRKRDADVGMGHVFDFEPRVHWCAEALLKFIELLDAVPVSAAPPITASVKRRAATSSGFAYIRSYYKVPATRGGRVRTSKNELGTITGTSGPHVKVRLDGEKHAHPYHPTDLTYLEDP